MKERGVSLPESLEMLVATEQSRGRFSLGDLENATKLLGFGRDGILDVELDEEVDDDFILGAYKSAVKRAKSSGDRRYRTRGRHVPVKAALTIRLVQMLAGADGKVDVGKSL